jgi:XTP/dITP diphosphohydrolase
VTARLVLATRNEHKVVELRQILAEALGGADVDLDAAVVGLDDASPDVVESGVTFAANALLKARAAARHSGLPAVADDSGLAVDVLGGSPGVFSARWSGRSGARADVDRANVELLLAQVSDVPDEHRGAGFVCAVALVLPDGTEVVEHGEVRGTLERAPRGTGGFGYDPVLRVEGGDRTLAEHAPEEKNAISHRGRAVRALLPRLLPVLGVEAGERR